MSDFVVLLCEWILLAGSVLLLVPWCVLAAELSAAIPVKRRVGTLIDRHGQATIIVPAHNEEGGICNTIHALRREMKAHDRLVVVADNCKDATAEVASSAGAEVVCREDPLRKGKAYALDAGLSFVDETGGLMGTLVFIDADCELSVGALDTLVAHCETFGQPIQARYSMRAADATSAPTGLFGLAWSIKNELRPKGLLALGLPCPLMGSGMAIPADSIRELDVASSHIAEDLQLGIELALRGHPSRFCPDAQVFSDFAPSEKGRATQKERWIHGHLLGIFEYVPRLIAESVRQRRAVLLAIMGDLVVPPLGLLVTLQFILFFVTLGWWLIASSSVPLLLNIFGLAIGIFSFFIAWMQNRDHLSLNDLLEIPFYVSANLGIVSRFLSGRRSEWVRTERPSRLLK